MIINCIINSTQNLNITYYLVDFLFSCFLAAFFFIICSRLSAVILIFGTRTELVLLLECPLLLCLLDELEDVLLDVEKAVEQKIGLKQIFTQLIININFINKFNE